MKFTCQTSDLNKAVQSVMPAIAAKPSTPIFGGMHIIADNNTLRLEGMDINLSMSNEIPAEVEEAGEIVIAASRFNDLVRNFNGETVKVTKSQNDNNVRLQSGKADYKILLMNVNEFPKRQRLPALQILPARCLLAYCARLKTTKLRLWEPIPTDLRSVRWMLIMRLT